VKIKASTDAKYYGVGEKVLITSTITNTSTTSCSVWLGKDPGFSPSFVVTNWKGVVVWDRCDHRDGFGACFYVLLQHPLKPGASYSETAVWDQGSRPHGTKPVRVPPGPYRFTTHYQYIKGSPSMGFKLVAGRPPLRATGDWGFSPLFLEISPPKAPLTMNLRLECFRTAGCSADGGLVFGPRDSYGRTIHFAATSATSEPLVTSSGTTVGKCTMDPSPFGDIVCRSSSSSVVVPDHGWVGSRDQITYTAFTPAEPGEPLAGDNWSDSPTGGNPGNKTDNDSQLILTPPVANPLLVFMNPTAVAFAAGEAPQTEQVGLICSTESFCPAPAGASFTAALGPAGVFYPQAAGQTQILSGIDIDYSCEFSDTGGYEGPGTNLATCKVASPTIIDRYGGAVLELPIRASASAYPQKFDYRLTLSAAHGVSGSGVYTDLVIVAGLRITTASKLPTGSLQHVYSLILQGTGGVPTGNGIGPPMLHHNWALLSGALPPGLSLTKGEIAGTPTKVGSYGFRLVLSDGQGDYVIGTFNMAVTA